MKHKTLMFAAVVSVAAWCSFAAAQAPSVNIDPQRHGNLAAAQESIVVAYIRIGDAQQGNDSHLGGHAAKAKSLLDQANEELRLAADFADQNQQGPPSSGPPSARSSLGRSSSGCSADDPQSIGNLDHLCI